MSLAALGGVLVPACATNESSLFIRACLLQPADTCLVQADTASTTLEHGLFDAAQGQDYHCPLLVGNQLVPRGDQAKLRTETSRIEISSATVTVLDSTGSSTIETFDVPASGFVDPGTASAPGYGLADVLLLDAVTASQHIGETLVASVIVRGRTLGGLDISSGEWKFPIQIAARESLCDLTNCIPGAKVAPSPTPNCHPGADAVTDCQTGCGCTVGSGDCAPLGCVTASKGATTGFCGACSSNADCTKPAKCVPFPTPTSPTGVCK